MALQSSGAISLSDLAAEFGVSAPYSLGGFYRGGGNVPNSSANSGVPTSGAISLTGFYGAQAEEVTISNVNINDVDVSGSNPTAATIWYESDGDIIANGGAYSSSDIGNWIDPKSAAPGSYQIRATLNSGTSPSGSAVGSWMALTSTRSWILSSSAGQSKTCNLTIQIRVGGVIQDSATVVLTADSSGS
tara:strand:- start:255 stop:821 length:567 start_codon:yes stop_codon:yes gene_type:complete